MKSPNTITIFAIFFFLTSTSLLIHKIDLFDQWRFVTEPKLFYITFILLFMVFIAFLRKSEVPLIKKVQKFLLSLLPTIITFFIAVNFFETALHWIFPTIIGFYFIALGSTFIYNYHKRYTLHKKPTKKTSISKNHKILTITLVILTVVVHLFFGLKNIGKAAYVDERLWVYDRIEQYWDNIREQDWLNTRPSDKPGVTTAIISGPGLFLFDPTDFSKGDSHKDQIEKLFMSLRIPQFLIVTFFAFLTFPLINKLLNTQIATFTMIFVMLSPILLGMSRIINPDAFLWIILFLCFISFLLYLKENSLKWIYVTGIFLGLALLTKYIANIFLVFFIALIFMDLILQREEARSINEAMRDRVIHYGIMLFTALSVFYVLFPGVWVKHDRLLIATIHSEAFASTWVYFTLLIACIIFDTFFCKSFVTKKIIAVCQRYKRFLTTIIVGIFAISAFVTIFNVYTEMSLFDFSRIIESPKSIYKEVGSLAIYFTSFFPLIFGVTPLVLIFSFFALFKTLGEKKWSHEKTVIIYCVLFILLYYFASTINNVVPIVRYQIILYPFMIFMASIGAYMVSAIFTKKHLTAFFISICIIFTCSLQLLHMSNFYFSYNSALLPSKYIINTKDMGDGNYEIAAYLNNLPHAKDLLVWTDKRGMCQFFVGTCNNMIQDPELAHIIPDVDYYVISQNRKNHIEQLTQHLINRPTYNVRLDKLYNEDMSYVYEIYPSDRDAHYIKIIDASTINIIN